MHARGISKYRKAFGAAALTVLTALALAGAAAADDEKQAEEKPAGPPYKSVADLQAAHDRALIRDLTEYVKQNPKADDLDQAYMVLFSKAIDHDWFSDNESAARAYLDGNPEGAVRPLAQIISTMARAQAGAFDDALTSYYGLMRGLDRPDQEEFAVNFADAFAGVATAAGEYKVSKRVYEALMKQYEQSPTLRQKVRDDLNRLEQVGKPATHTGVKDLTGKVIRLDDYRGKYVLVDFWATWCAPCVAELPNVQAAYTKYHEHGFEIIGVSLDETTEPLVDFVKARKIPWRQVHNATSGGDWVDAFGVTNIPATYLIDPEGTIIRLELRGATLDRTLAKLLKPAAAETQSK